MMRILSYSGESVVTTDGVGEAVVDYARALIAENSADVIDIPVVFEDGEFMASMVLGSASPLMMVPSHDAEVSLRDELTIARLRAKTAALGPHTIVPSEAGVADRDELAFDFL
jgi:hypothetical protein